MISEYRENTLAVFYGLSTDTKPTGVENGRKFIEMDTGKTYYYSASGSGEWIDPTAD